MARRRCSFYIEEALTDRLRLYVNALGRQASPVSMAGIIEAALWDYLEARCDRMGGPLDGSSPGPAVRYRGPGRPSAAARAAAFRPQLEHRAGRYAGQKGSFEDFHTAPRGRAR